jgi:hypothetical protein
MDLVTVLNIALNATRKEDKMVLTAKQAKKKMESDKKREKVQRLDHLANLVLDRGGKIGVVTESFDRTVGQSRIEHIEPRYTEEDAKNLAKLGYKVVPSIVPTGDYNLKIVEIEPAVKFLGFTIKEAVTKEVREPICAGGYLVSID